jgi:hypothetical protein
LSLATYFEKLSSRVRQRTTSAQERIEKAAQTLAGGKNSDVASIEDALHDATMTVDQFRERVEFHSARREHFQRLEKLGIARTKVEGLDKRIAAEEAKHAEIVEAFRARWAALRDEATAAQRDVDGARDSRDWLLAPENAPLHLADRYGGLLAEESVAVEGLAAAEREVRSIKERVKSEEGWLVEIAAEGRREIHAPEAVITTKQRERLSGQAAAKYDEHEQKLTRFRKRLVEAEKTVEDCRKTLVSAEAAVAQIRKEILAV